MSTEFAVFKKEFVPELTKDCQVITVGKYVEDLDDLVIGRRSFPVCYFNESIVSNMDPSTKVYLTDNTP